AVLLDEFAGAVERIHQPVARPGAALLPGDAGGFLAQHGNGRVEPAQALADDAVRSQVGLGQWRIVVLRLDAEIAGIDVEDGGAGGAGQGDAGFAQLGHARPSRTSRTMKRAASERPSEQSSRRASSPRRSRRQGMTSSGSGSSPGRRSGYRSSARTRWMECSM